MRRRAGVWIAAAAMAGGCAGHGPATPDAADEYRLGVAAQHDGNFDSAVGHFQSALRADSSFIMANVRLADLYRSDGNYVQAATHYQSAATLDPYSASDEYELGVCYEFLRRFQDAAGAYLRSLKLQPTNEQASMNLGLVYLALGQTRSADECLHRATQLDPSSGSAWLNYGVTLDAEGRLSDAESAYRRAIELHASLTAALEDLAANLIAQHKGREAVQTAEQLLLREDTAIARTRYGQALQLTGDDAGAEKQFDLALQRDPASWIALTAKGDLMFDEYRKGLGLDEPKKTAAVALWQKSLSINPNQPQVAEAVNRWKNATLLGS